MHARDIKIEIAPKKGNKEPPTESALSTIDTRTNLEAALITLEAGFQPIPIIPGKKIPTLKHNPWLGNLSTESINAYWTKHPNHEVGCITGVSIIVLDVDTPESKANLYEIEEAFDIIPNFIIGSTKGGHHYFGLAGEVFAKSDAHSSETYPDRIDIRTGSGLVIMPPSTGKVITLCEITHAEELTEVGQDFVDAIFRHNGRPVPRRQTDVLRRSEKPVITNHRLKELDALVSHLDANCGYQDWITPGMALHHETEGSEEGLSIWNDWSSQGEDYPGPDEVEAKWKSFEHRSGNPVTIRTLCKMVEYNGHDWLSILDRMGPQFEKCDCVVVHPEGSEQFESNASNGIAFDGFSLTGQSEMLELRALKEVFVLAGLALMGQWTVIYAIHNAGKTLLVLHLLLDAFRREAIDPKDTYYFNLDDTLTGLIDKTKIAEEFGMKIICDGFGGFKVSEFIGHIEELCTANNAHGKILILDTLKKFTDLMDKRLTAKWNRIIRRFITKGGTVIGLAHVNKNRGCDGKPVYAGTSDIIDDADCAYVLDVIATEGDFRTVEFENRKRRGNVVNKAAYQYSIEEDIGYDQLLASVEHVDAARLTQAKHTIETQSDSVAIEVIATCITEGFVTKMRLRDEANKRSGTSKRKVVDMIEKYTGEDPDKHRWFYTTQRHGRKVYQLLS